MRSNVIFKLCDLKKLISDEDSCVEVCKQCCRTLKFLPSQTRNLKQSVKESLDSAIGSYDSELNGIILNSKNIKVQPFTKLVDDGYLAVTYKGDIYIFNPKIGSILKGIVNKKSDDHIGVLVHSVFNVVIPRPANKSFSSWTGSQLNIGDNVVFKVNEVNFGSPLLYIRGNFIDSDSNTDCDLTDSGIEGNDQNFNDPNPNEISKLIHQDCSSNEDEVASLTKVIPTGNSVRTEKLCLDKQSESDKKNCSLYERDSDKMDGIPNITYRKQNLEKTKGKLFKKSLTNISDKKKQILNNKDDGKTRLKETLSPTEDKDNFQAKKFEENSKSPEKSLKTKAFMKANSNPQKKLAEYSSYSLEDEIISKGKLLKIGSPVNLNTSARKTPSENSSSSVDEINQHKLLEIKSPKKHNTSTQKLSAGNSNSSNDDIDQHSKSLEIKSPVKRNTSARKSSLGSSSSSEDENTQDSKLLKIKSLVNHNTSAQKPPTEDSSSSEDENDQHTKLPEVNSSVKHNTFAQKPLAEDFSSSEDDNNQLEQLLEIKSPNKHSTSARKIIATNSVSSKGHIDQHGKSLKIKSPVKHNTSARKSSLGNSSSSDGENIQGSKLLKIKSSVKHNTSAQKPPTENYSSSEDENDQQTKLSEVMSSVKHNTSAKKPSKEDSSSSDDDNNQLGQLLEIKSPNKHSKSARKITGTNSISLKDGLDQHGKSLKINITSAVKRNTSAQKSSLGNSSSSEDENIQDSKLLKIKSPNKHSTSAAKITVTNSISSKDDIDQHGKLLEIKSPLKHNTSVRKSSLGNSSSSENENIQGSKLLKIKSSVKHNTSAQKPSTEDSSSSEDEKDQQTKLPEVNSSVKHNTSAQKPSTEVSSSSEDENDQQTKLPEVNSSVKHNTSAQKPSTEDYSSSEDENDQQTKLPEVNSSVKHNTSAQKPSTEDSSSSEDENDQHIKLLEVNSSVKHTNTAQKLSVENLRSLENLEIQKVRLKKDTGKKHKQPNLKRTIESSLKHKNIQKKCTFSEDDNNIVKKHNIDIKNTKHSLENSKLSSKGINIENDILLKLQTSEDQNKPNILTKEKEIAMGKRKQNSSSESGTTNPSRTLKADEENNVDLLSVQKRTGKETYDLSLVTEVIDSGFISKLKKKKKKHKTEKLLSDFGSVGVIENKNHSNKKNVLDVKTKSFIDQLDLRYENKPPKIKAKKHKKSNMEVAYVNQPSSNHKEGDKLLFGESMKNANKQNVLGVETKSLIDQLDLRLEDNPSKIKAKTHKKSNMEVAYVNKPSSNHKEGDKLLSGVSMEKANKQNVLGVETKSLIDQLDLRLEDNPSKIKAKKHKKSNVEVAFVNQPSSNHKEGDKLLSGVNMEKANKQNVLGFETKSLIDQLDLRLDNSSKIKAKKHKKSNMEVEYVSKPSSNHKEDDKLLSGVSMEKANKQSVLGFGTKSLIDQLDLRLEDNPSKIKAKKHKKSNMEVAYVNQPSSNHKEGDKLLSGVSMEKANKQNVLGFETKSLIDQLDLRLDNPSKIKAKKHKKSNMEVEYVSKPSSNHKEDDKLLSGVSMEKANKQSVLGFGTKSLIDQLDLRLEDNPSKIKAKKHKKSNMEIAYVSEPSSVHKEGVKPLSGVSMENAIKKRDKTTVNKTLNKNTEGSSDLISLLLAKAAVDIKENSPQTNKRKRKEKKDKKKCKKKTNNELVTEDGTSDLLKDVFKSLKSDGIEQNNIEGLGASGMNKKSLSKKNIKRTISMQSKEIIPSISKDPKVHKKKKRKNDLSLDEMTSALLTKALIKLNKTVSKTGETSITNTKEDNALKTNNEVDIGDDIESIPCYQKPIEKETFHSEVDRVNTLSTKKLCVSMPNTEDRQRKIPPSRKSVSFQNYVSSVLPLKL